MDKRHLRVLITTDWYTGNINGVVTSVVNLKNELERRGHEVMIVTLSNRRRSWREGNTIYIGSLGMGAVYTGARARLYVKEKWIRQMIAFKPDIVHSQCEFSTFSIALRVSREMGIPLVHTYHTIYEDYAHYIFPIEKLGHLAAKRFSRRACNKVDCVITPTGKIKDLLEDYRVESDISVVPSGLEMEHFNHVDGMHGVISKKDLGIGEDVPVLLFLGRLAQEKNLDEILNYLKGYRKREIAFLIVGDGPARDKLQRLAEELPDNIKLIFTGFVDPKKVPIYYQVSDLFVSASQSETQGLTYIEAAASGLPLLCREDDCLLNVIQQGGNGWEYRTREEFMKYLQEFLELDEEARDEMSKKSSEMVEALDIHVTTPKIIDIYETLIDEEKGEK